MKIKQLTNIDVRFMESVFLLFYRPANWSIALARFTRLGQTVDGCSNAIAEEVTVRERRGPIRLTKS